MRKLIFILTIIFAQVINVQSSYSQSPTDKTPTNCVEVIYFHGKKRCASCNAIENLTYELLNIEYSKQLNNKEIIFKTIDISTRDGSVLGDKYEVANSSLYINKWSQGNEKRNNMSDVGFTYARSNPELFKEKLRIKINELLKQK